MTAVRHGNFTSSNIHKLMSLAKDGKSFGKPAFTYIQETKWERRLGRAINIEKDSNSTLWGKLLESMVHDILPEEYRLMSKKRFIHPTIENWSGMPDLTTPTSVGDIKCPEPKAFMGLIDVFELEKNNQELVTPLKAGHFLKEENPDYYWQLVSNSILTNKNRAELIVFMPKSIRYKDIVELASNTDNQDNPFEFYRLYQLRPESMALMPDECEIEELHIFAFDVPEEDKALLTSKVLQANSLL